MALEGIGDEECMGLSLGVFHLIGRLQRFVFFHVKIKKAPVLFVRNCKIWMVARTKTAVAFDSSSK